MTLVLPNRRDVARRHTQQDLAAQNPSNPLSAPFGRPCSPCTNCKKGGAITDCSHCPSATTLYQFQFSDVGTLVTGLAGDGVLTYTVEWASGCLWESDDLPMFCGGGTDEFGFALEFGGTAIGDVTLTFSRRSGPTTCPGVTFVYKNIYPARCLCPLVMFLDDASVAGVNFYDLPCAVCVMPAYPQNCLWGPQSTCGCPQNWRVDIGGSVYETTSGPMSSHSVTAPPQTWCMWWTVAGPPYVLVYTDIIYQQSNAMVISSYSDKPGGTLLNPFAGATRTGVWTLVGAGGTCFGNCWNGVAIPRNFGPGPATVIPEHING